jgi:hypothetical protein
MGESSQFILSAIWLEGLIQIQNWKVERMQNYIVSLQKSAITELKNLGMDRILPLHFFIYSFLLAFLFYLSTDLF